MADVQNFYNIVQEGVMLLLLLFYWPPVRDMCLNNEVAMFQPQTGIHTNQGYVANCYVAILL